jgi:outer membrane protein assembly factor BamB
VKQQLLIGLFALIAAIGCQSHPQSNYVAVPANGFVKQWQADVQLGHDELSSMYVQGDQLIAYTKDNVGYWFSADGGALQAINKIAPHDLIVHPPVGLTDRIAIPTSDTIETYDKAGKHLDSFPRPNAIQTDGAAIGNSLFVGVAYPGSGRLARLDVTQTIDPVWELWMPVGMRSAPATFGDAVFAASVAGNVWAVTINRDAVWNLPDNIFRTDNIITAGLAVDDYGLYVPSQDKKLYCLERTTGKIKWSFYAGMPLIDQPIVIGNTVYQMIPDRGLAAISKTEGNLTRTALWIQPKVRQMLAADSQYLYVRFDPGVIVALDKATGTPQFRSEREHFDVFATNLNSPLIYAATKDGHIFAVRPVLRPGTVGEVVLLETPLGRMID